MSSLETIAKTKLISLVKALDPVVEQQLEQFTEDEIKYVLEHFKQYLHYDLTRDFEKHRSKGLKDSPFDDLFND
jgi:predicted hydrolase (HD superfamily)|tara:strand:- start:495 stop:716 length:222 start_codon:yes stop_codon:yes gene_type:complete